MTNSIIENCFALLMLAMLLAFFGHTLGFFHIIPLENFLQHGFSQSVFLNFPNFV